MFDIFQYSFMQRALLTGLLLSVSCSLLGVFLLQRRLSLIGDGLAHVSFAGVAIGILLGGSPLLVSIPIVMASSILILKISNHSGFDNDAAIGFISATAVAVGVLIASLAGGFDVDLLSYLFGSILSVQWEDVISAALLAIVLIITVSATYHKLLILTYDEDFARSSRIKVERYNTLLVLLTSLTVVIGIRVVGTLLISSLIIVPSMSAMQLAKSFKQTLWFSIAISLFSVISGIVLSALVPLPDGRSLPTGATIVIVNSIFFLFASFCKYIKNR